MLSTEEMTIIQLEAIRREPPSITTPEALKLRKQLDRDVRHGKGMIDIPDEWPMPGPDSRGPIYDAWKKFDKPPNDKEEP